MRILLTGSTGQVGLALRDMLPSLGELIVASRATLDLARPDSIRGAVREARPDVIVNAAAFTGVDRAEAESELAMQVNSVAPGVLAEEARRLGSLLVHYSTDYVFDGQKRSPYTEGDLPKPINVYGTSKLEGERRIRQAGCRHVVLRTSWVYAPHGKNFFLTIARKAKAGQVLHVVADQEGVPTESDFLAEITLRLIEREAEGLFNAVPSGTTTWHGFAEAIVAKLGLQTTVQPIRARDYPTAARRPPYSVLSNEKLTRALGPAPSWSSLLDRCVAAFNALAQ